MPGEPFFFFGGSAGRTAGASIAPSQTSPLTVLRAFLIDILPVGTGVIQGQGNRVPEPKAVDFVVMTPIRRDRIETNIDTYRDINLAGAITGNVLTVTSINGGTLTIGARLSGVGMLAGTRITGFLTGYGVVGTYFVNLAQSWPVSSAIGSFVIGISAIGGVAGYPISVGASDFMQPTKFTVQLDVHGPNSGDNAQIISTLFRDAYAVDFMAPSVSPLYADDPRQAPFINDQDQYEYRWIVEAVMQIDPVVTVSGVEFADTVTLSPTIPADIPTAQ